ncbi:MAG: BrnA antitoxin family protein [Acidisphaera sp.]|nr:BrnA antitoxin family protein [Acidisphaera sp.]
MSENEDIRRYSLAELKQRRAQGRTGTRPDAPAFPLEDDFWQSARVVMPTGKSSVHLRVDTDVLEWFRTQGKGHLTRMNAVLRSYMEAHKR